MSGENQLNPAVKALSVIWLVIGAMVFIVGYGLYQAWIVEQIWLWYMTAKFGAPVVSLSECYVILLAFRMILPSVSGDEWKKDAGSKMAANVIMWAILLGVARWLR